MNTVLSTPAQKTDSRACLFELACARGGWARLRAATVDADTGSDVRLKNKGYAERIQEPQHEAVAPLRRAVRVVWVREQRRDEGVLGLEVEPKVPLPVLRPDDAPVDEVVDEGVLDARLLQHRLLQKLVRELLGMRGRAGTT